MGALHWNDLRPVSGRIFGNMKNGCGDVYCIRSCFKYGGTRNTFKKQQDAVKLTPGFSMKPVEGVNHEAEF